MQSSMRRLTPLWLALGFGGLAAAGVLALLRGQFDPYAQSSLAVALVGFMLALVFNRESAQTWLGGRQARYGGNTLVMAVAFLAIVVMINYIVYQNPRRWDLSEDQTNTLAPETLEALKQLSSPVKAVGFYSTNYAGVQRTATDLLESYRVAAPGKFSYEFHDPVGDPVAAKEYNIVRDGTVVLVMGDQREELSSANEQDITAALVRFAHPGKRVLYFLTGHGERPIEATGDESMSGIVELLKKQNYEVQPLNLQVTTTVPSDARAIVVAGPLVPLSADEVNTLSNYLQNAPQAALIVLLDPVAQTQVKPGEAEPLVNYLQSAWGVNLPPDIVIDLRNGYVSPGNQSLPLFPLNKGYESSPITSKLLGISSVFPVARSIAVTGTAETFPDIVYTPLVKTDEEAWGETDLQSLQGQTTPTLGEGDSAGPLVLALAAENRTSQARLIVFGDSDYTSDANFAGNPLYTLGANANLFINSVNWATTEESLLNLTLKTPISRSLDVMDNTTFIAIGILTIGGMPLLVVILGVVVWFQRRRHG